MTDGGEQSQSEGMEEKRCNVGEGILNASMVIYQWIHVLLVGTHQGSQSKDSIPGVGGQEIASAEEQLPQIEGGGGVARRWAKQQVDGVWAGLIHHDGLVLLVSIAHDAFDQRGPGGTGGAAHEDDHGVDRNLLQNPNPTEKGPLEQAAELLDCGGTWWWSIEVVMAGHGQGPIDFGELLEQYLAAGGLFAQMGYDLEGSCEDVIHDANLSGAFGRAGLVDADAVDPYQAIGSLPANVCKDGVAVCLDLNVFGGIAKVNRQSRGVIAPGV
jgi:hypothetical protein